MGTIRKRKQGGKSYYIYQETYRKKINLKDTGKIKGSGKSKVCTRTIYLGNADEIIRNIKEKRTPAEVEVRNFGLVSAAYQAAQSIKLQEILKKHIPGNRNGIPSWVFFFVTILNRIEQSTSKNKMSEWLKKGILPELMEFDPCKFTSKNFWYATDDVISEKELQEKRTKTDKENDLFAEMNVEIFKNIETELFYQIERLIGFSPSVIFYDTTNFYTYIEEPKRSKLANTCHSKESKHHLNHIGLLMAVEKGYGIPLFNRVYKANTHDSKVFSFVVAELIITLKKLCSSGSELVLVFDKGNNKKEIFSELTGKISWIGSLIPSNYGELIEIDITEYHGIWKDKHYYRCQKEIMGINSVVVVIFNKATKRKQEYSLERGIEKLKQEIKKKWDGYKKPPIKITKGIETIKKDSSYGIYLDISLKESQICIELNRDEIENRKKTFGKLIIFSDMLQAETCFLIDTYIEKNIIEDDFHLLKDSTIIRFRPIRHWTDSKICAYAFCCVVSMTLIRVMQWMVEQSGYKMSPNLLKDELTDIKEVIMIYDLNEAKRKIVELSTVQKNLWKVFNLGEIKETMALHNSS